MLYKEYLHVESDFIPVFSSGTDKTSPDLWKSFYPHESFRELLTLTLDSLDKATALKDRSIWMSGIYGTGKTYASFVIKHILEDELTEVEKYFRHYDMSGLFERLVGIRSKGKILVVHQSSSAGIDNQNKFFNTIIESVKRSLREKGYRYTGTASMLERVIATLKDPDSSFNFSGAFRKYRDKFLEYDSSRGVIQDLETLQGSEQLRLLDVIVEVAEMESYLWTQSAQEVIDRLRDLRRKNNLCSIFFIWDEFTEFFLNNRNNITGLQELAQNSSELSFYFLLITHHSDGQLIEDRTQRKIIEARFKSVQLTLAPKCAFELLARDLSVKKDLKQEWAKISGELWAKVKRCVTEHLVPNDNSLTAADFIALFPIHPYAARLLKFISQAISSNQRTMFSFLCSEQVGSFEQFIDSHGFSYGGDNFLTADSLWDYFFQVQNLDLDESFLEIISCFDKFSPLATEANQIRILKTALLFCALQKKSYIGRADGAASLLRATLKNISACFIGTSLENEVRSTMNYFIERGIFNAVEEVGDTLYLLSSGVFNSERLENIRRQMQQEFSFDAIINAEDAFNKFLPTDFLKGRLVIKIGTPISFQGAGQRKSFLADNQILLVLIFVGEEAEQAKVDKAIEKIRAENPTRCIIADFSGTPFTKQRREKYILNKAREFYFQELPNQEVQSRLSQRQAGALVEEWINLLSVTQTRIFLSDTPDFQLVFGEVNFLKSLRTANRKFFECGAEEISVNDRLFATNGLTETIAKIGLESDRARGSYVWLNFIGDAFRELVERGGAKYWQTIPAHPISKMKNIVEEYIAKSLAQDNEIKFNGIWGNLKCAPTGLLKCAGSVFLLSLLLKDYVDSDLYLKDTSKRKRLTKDLLCALIVNAVKESAGEKILVRQTASQVKRCWIISELFGAATCESYSLEESVPRIKNRLTHVQTPFCLLSYFVEEHYREDTSKVVYLRLLSLLSELLQSKDAENALSDDLFSPLEKNPAVVTHLKEILQEKNFDEALKIFCAGYRSQTGDLLTRLQLGDNEFRDLLTKKFSCKESYLWTLAEVQKCIEDLKEELQMVDAINQMLPVPQKTFSGACRALKEKMNKIRLPRALVEELAPALKELLPVLSALTRNEVHNFSSATEQIKRSAQAFSDFFEHQFDFFRKAVTLYVEALPTTQVVENLFSTASTGYFFKTQDDFVVEMKKILDCVRLNERNAAFLATWVKLTDSTSPSDWSKKNGLPILCLFQDCLEQAQKYFSALNEKKSLNTPQLEGTLSFVRELGRLKNKDECERAFVKYFCGENYSVLVDAESLRSVLRRKLGNEVYSWFSKKKNCEVQIRFLAERKYREQALPIVRELILQMPAAASQKYLLELIERDTLLGIRVLQNSKGG